MRFVVSAGEEGLRLDVFLGNREAVGSRSQAAALLAAAAVRVDGRVRPKSYRVTAGEVVVVRGLGSAGGEQAGTEYQAQAAAPAVPALAAPVPAVPALAAPVLAVPALEVSVPYEDRWLLVADKPAGMVVHRSPGHAAGTLVDALRHHGLAGGEDFRPGIVHRLDRETSGLLIVAKDAGVHRRLQEMIRERRVDRRYLALIHGNPAAATGTIDAPVGRDPARRKTMVVGGVAPRAAVTHFAVRERLGAYTLVEVRLDTGRTHQIRVHFLAIGHPVVGDPTYARRDPLEVGRQFLHSWRLVFLHPVTGEVVRVESALPADLEAALGRARARGGG
ncbi:MAG: RluA family pseudouridine synthase [Actinobacteria bacterium]|nr:RluA family pseudouridine synthase [Actinomycetota bacterium]